MQQDIQIPAGVAVAGMVTFLSFLLGHLITAIIFAVKMSGRVSNFMAVVNNDIRAINKSITELQTDVKAMVKFDSKIEVLHERMNQSQEDRRMLWNSLENFRKNVSDILKEARP